MPDKQLEKVKSIDKLGFYDLADLLIGAVDHILGVFEVGAQASDC